MDMSVKKSGSDAAIAATKRSAPAPKSEPTASYQADQLKLSAKPENVEPKRDNRDLKRLIAAGITAGSSVGLIAYAGMTAGAAAALMTGVGLAVGGLMLTFIMLQATT